MAGKEPKNATVIMKVDLGCGCCSKKIKWALCKLQGEFNIISIVFDEKKNTITVSGPFNPDCFIKKIRCMACKVIICIEIKPPDKPPVTPPPPPPPPPKQEVNVSISICCCRPCPCYQPHLGCNRCCSCGHLSTCPPSGSSCSGGVSTCPPSGSSCSSGVSTCPPSGSSCSGGVSTCPQSRSSCSGGVSTCPPSRSSCSGGVSTCPSSRSSCSGGYSCGKVVYEEEPFYGCSIM